MNETLGLRLAVLLEENSLTQTQLSKDTGIAQSTISGLIHEEKKTTETSYKTIVVLSKYFGVSADWLLGLSSHRTVSQSCKISGKTTGLSDKAVQKLVKWKKKNQHPLRPYIWEYDYIGILERLICTDEGNKLLRRLQEYLNGDFSGFYIENKDGEVVPYENPINIKNPAGGYSYIYPEAIEQIALDAVREQVKIMKKGEE